MKRKDYLEMSQINEILSGLIGNTDHEMDMAIVEDILGEDKIRRIACERITIKRIRNILKQAAEKE